MGDRLPFSELENIDIEAARKRLNRAMAKRNEAEREVHAARHAYERLIHRNQEPYIGHDNGLHAEWAQ